jgi:hypothetical protein
MRLFKKNIELTAGKAKERVTVMSLTDTPVTGGGIQRGYSQEGFIQCIAEPQRGSRRLEQSGLKWNKVMKLWTRDVATPSLHETKKLMIRGESYTIHSVVIIDFQDRWVEILAYN